LASGEGNDLLFDRVASDQPVDVHRPGLANPVGAVDRLVFGGGVPPGVEQEAVVGLGEVEAEATGLEADQEDGVVAGTEALEHACALPCPAVEVAVADALSLEPLAHHGEEAGELAEHERPVATPGDIGELLGELVKLRTGGVAAGVDEAGVEAELPQQRDRAQDGEAVAVE